MEREDFCAALGVSEYATAYELKNAYVEKMDKYYEDGGLDTEHSRIEMEELSQAYEVFCYEENPDIQKQDYYNVLGVQEDATVYEISYAFVTKMKKARRPLSADAQFHEQFLRNILSIQKQLTEAFFVLGHEGRRRIYDENGEYWNDLKNGEFSPEQDAAAQQISQEAFDDLDAHGKRVKNKLNLLYLFAIILFVIYTVLLISKAPK